VAFGRMDDHAGRFVDDGENFVFVEQVERNRLWLRAFGGWRRKLELNGLIGAQFVGRFSFLPVDCSETLGDAALDSSPGKTGWREKRRGVFLRPTRQRESVGAFPQA